jgi:hypothetical protein
MNGFIKQLMQGFAQQKEATLPEKLDQHQWCQQVIQKYKDLNLSSLEDFSFVLHKEIGWQGGELFRHMFMVKMTSVQFYRLEFLFTQHDFIVNHLEDELQEAEDVNWLPQCLLNNKVPAEKIAGHKLAEHLPLWFDWINSMVNLYYGDCTDYIHKE